MRLKRVRVDRYSRTTYDRVPEPPPRVPKGADRLTIMEDTDGDGRADKFKDFVSDLNLCTGLEFGYGGVFIIQSPYLLFYPDRDGDGVPDGDPEVLLAELRKAESETANLRDQLKAILAEALLAYLDQTTASDSIRFRNWLEREVVFPAATVRRRLGIRDENHAWRAGADAVP